MEISRMSNSDMIQYCNEALAWEELGPVDIHFFESVKVDEPEDIFDEEGFFTEQKETENYYNPGGEDFIHV